MRVLVCGGRDFKKKSLIYRILDELSKEHDIECIIEGDAEGVDRIAGSWAQKKRIMNVKYQAEWNLYGSSAGPIRNNKMLKEGKPDLVIAFPGGKGTDHMKEIARKALVKVLEVKPRAGFSSEVLFND